MSVLDKTLLQGESIQIRSRYHKAMLFTQPVAMLISTMVIAAAFRGMFVGTIIAWGLALTVLSAFGAVIKYLGFEAALTTARVLTKNGLVSTHCNEILFLKVEAIDVVQNLFGRMLGYGSLVITGTGGSKTVIPGIPDPYGFRSVLQQHVASVQSRPIHPTLAAA